MKNLYQKIGKINFRYRRSPARGGARTERVPSRDGTNVSENFVFPIFWIGIMFLVLVSIISPILTFADTGLNYTLLEPLPYAQENTSNVSQPTPTQYLERAYYFGLTIAVIFALLMLVIAGIEYTAAGVSLPARDDAKKRIAAALTGLLLAFISWLLLYTINPDLVNPNIFLEEIESRPTETQPPTTRIANCTPEALSEKYGGLALAQNSPALTKLLYAIGQRITQENIPLIALGTAYTFEIGDSPRSNLLCNQTLGLPLSVCGINDCAHSIGSKHYGRKDAPAFYRGANAVDFTMSPILPDVNADRYGDRLIRIAREEAVRLGLPGFRGFCERRNGGSEICSDVAVDHIHIEIGP